MTKPRVMRADDLPRPLAEILPELRACSTAWEPQVALVGNVRADEVTRAVDAAFLAQRALSLFTNTPGFRTELSAGRMAFFIEGESAVEWAAEIDALINEMRETLR